MPVLRMDSKEFADYHRKLAAKFKPTLIRGVQAGAQRAVQYLVEATRAAPPANPAGIGTGGAVNTGAFIREWKATKTPDGADITNRKPYGPIIEWGRRVGARMPPKQAIVDWIKRRILTAPPKKKAAGGKPRQTQGDKQRDHADLERKKKHLLDGEKHGPKPPPKYGPNKPSKRQASLETTANRLQFVIRRAISRRGLIGRRIATSDMAQRTIKNIVRQEMLHEIDRELAKK